MRLTHGPQIERFLAQLQVQIAGELGYRAENVSGMGYSGEQTHHPYFYVRYSHMLWVYMKCIFGFCFPIIISFYALIFHFHRPKNSSVFVDGRQDGFLMYLTVKNNLLSLQKMITVLVQPKDLLLVERSCQQHPRKILGAMKYQAQNLIASLGRLC